MDKSSEGAFAPLRYTPGTEPGFLQLTGNRGVETTLRVSTLRQFPFCSFGFFWLCLELYRCEATAGFLLSVRAPDSQSTEFSVVIFHRFNSCWQPLRVILFT